ncbi:MAG: hypothetical protein LBJ65_21940 [Burkholderia sp.]|jgi:hypothetical protein|uniref:hypothetical protein n=1 Tax=Burkholderia sp. TaxID=36773 RepID=UPI002831C00F|nr:hypothetical protein [Burkholderia sp.]MDR0244268.1 hypothetical protein [Burkholderia sp.]
MLRIGMPAKRDRKKNESVEFARAECVTARGCLSGRALLRAGLRVRLLTAHDSRAVCEFV